MCIRDRNSFNQFSVVEGIHVNVDGTPPALVIFVDWYDADALLTVQVRCKGGYGPWFADYAGFALGLPVRCLVGDIKRTVSLVESPEETGKPFNVFRFHKEWRGSLLPLCSLERDFVI